jgi:hypothetical protein
MAGFARHLSSLLTRNVTCHSEHSEESHSIREKQSFNLNYKISSLHILLEFQISFYNAIHINTIIQPPFAAANTPSMGIAS